MGSGLIRAYVSVSRMAMALGGAGVLAIYIS